MAKCKISAQKQEDSLHLSLSGEFDDMSICELIDVLKDNCVNGHQVIIHTDSLKNVSVSGIGRDVFERNMNSFNENSVDIKFMTGNGSKSEAFGCFYAE